MAWVKGQSGNPKGRRPGDPPRNSLEIDVRELAKRYTKPAILTAARLMEDKKVPPATRLAAADLLLKRGHGNPITPVANPDLTPLSFADMTEEQLLANVAKIDATLAKVRASNDESKPGGGLLN